MAGSRDERPARAALLRGALLLALAIAIPAGLAIGGAGSGEVGIDEVSVSPDVTIALESPTLIVADEDAAFEQAGGSPALALLGALPPGADLAGYHVLPTGDQAFVLDITVELPGSPGAITATPRDIVSYNGTTYAVVATTSGHVPAGARIDALSFAGTLPVISFDTSVSLPGPAGSTLIADDEDLVVFDTGGGVYVMAFDGSANGLPSAVDLDAAHITTGGRSLFSLDITGTVGGVLFHDEDVLEFDPSTGVVKKRFVMQDRDSDWLHADLDAFHLFPGLCGDANADDYVGEDDGDEIRQLLIGDPLPPGGDQRCSVRGGGLDCNILDWVVLKRSLPAPGLAPGIEPVCEAFAV